MSAYVSVALYRDNNLSLLTEGGNIRVLYSCYPGKMGLCIARLSI